MRAFRCPTQGSPRIPGRFLLAALADRERHGGSVAKRLLWHQNRINMNHITIKDIEALKREVDGVIANRLTPTLAAANSSNTSLFWP